MTTTHRGWTISHMDYGSGYYAIGPDYDVYWLGEEDAIVAEILERMVAIDAEIDAWIEEQAA